MRASAQAIETHRIAARDEGLLVGRHPREVLGQGFARLWPRAVGVRVVGGPHDVLHPDPRALGHADEIANECGVSLDLLKPRTHCDNKYSALRVLRKSGHGISEGRRWFVSGVEQERQSLGMDCVTVYVFDQEGRPVQSNCEH